MKERGMLFSPPMVRALLDGSKTQTRRVVKTQPDEYAVMLGDQCLLVHDSSPGMHNSELISCPYGQPGDRLWVRENFSGPHCMGNASPSKWAHSSRIWYWADGNPTEGDWTSPKPSIHMPRWASRLDLEITGVRVERLQDCSEADAIAEGVRGMERYLAGGTDSEDPDSGLEAGMILDPRFAYQMLWESINGPGSWDANPWVWVIEFRRIK